MKRSAFLLILSFIAIISLSQGMYAMSATGDQIIPGDTSERKIQIMPSFKGGDLWTFSNWVYSTIKYPNDMNNEKRSGDVKVRFVVDEKGRVRNIEVIESTHPSFSQEVVNVVKSSPKWKPGISDGEAVKVSFTLPVMFRHPESGR